MTAEGWLGPEWEIPLHMPRRNRAGDIILALIVAFLAIVFLGGMAALFIALISGFWGYLFGALIGVVAVTVLGSAMQTVRRSTRRPVRLRLFPDALEIDHYLRFRRPCRIPKERIRSVIVDPTHYPGPAIEEVLRDMSSAERKARPRLPISGHELLDEKILDESSVGKFLYSTRGSPLPLVVSELKDPPNFAVIFDEPVVLATARRGFLVESSSWSHVNGTADFYMPHPKRAVPGFLATAVDTYKVYATFDAWGVLPTSEAKAADLLNAFPSREELARRRAVRYRNWLAVAAAIVVFRLIADRLSS